MVSGTFDSKVGKLGAFDSVLKNGYLPLTEDFRYEELSYL
jgi:hypothetical protein